MVKSGLNSYYLRDIENLKIKIIENINDMATEVGEQKIDH